MTSPIKRRQRGCILTSEGLKKWLLKRCFYTSKKAVLKEVSDDYRKEFDSKIIKQKY